MEALRVWRASSNLFGSYAASRPVRPLRLRTLCCSAASATAKSPSHPPQDRRRRRSASSSTTTSDRGSIRTIRLKKVEELREKGYEPHAYKWDRTHTAKELQEKYAHLGNGEVCEEAALSNVHCRKDCCLESIRNTCFHDTKYSSTSGSGALRS